MGERTDGETVALAGQILNVSRRGWFLSWRDKQNGRVLLIFMSNTLRNIFQLSETCRSRGPRALAMTLMKQTIVQHEYLRTRNFRRPSILNIFERLARVGQTECAMPQHNDDIAQLAQEAKEDIAVGRVVPCVSPFFFLEFASHKAV